MAVLEATEHALRQIDGHRRDAHAAGADPGLRAHALAGPQRRREQAVGQWTGAAGAHRGLVRAPYLPLDLGLAEDHRLKARGHAIELARGVAVAWRVDRLGQLRRADLRAAGQQPEDIGLGLANDPPAPPPTTR